MYRTVITLFLGVLVFILISGLLMQAPKTILPPPPQKMENLAGSITLIGDIVPATGPRMVIYEVKTSSIVCIINVTINSGYDGKSVAIQQIGCTK
jgi:hypothetical protein